MGNIGVEAFRESGLKSITLPQSVKEVGAYAFYKCGQLQTVKLNEGLETLGARELVNRQELEGYVFAETWIESIQIPSTLKVIQRNTFSNCKHLR